MNNKRVGIIVQARMGSTRLPGKCMMEVLNKPLLGYLLERLKRVQGADEVIVAATEDASDDVIEQFCKDENISCFRGPVEDVLLRYYQAATQYKLDVVIRVTGDCPLVDPVVIDQVLDFYLSNSNQYDLVANSIDRTYPRGINCEIFSFEILKLAHEEANEKPDREHVTTYIRRNDERFKMGNMAYSRNLGNLRWTVDTKEDFDLIEKMIEALYPNKPQFTFEDCIDLVEKQPELQTINQHVKQKAFGQ